MLEYVQRRLCVALTCRLMQHLRHLRLTLCAALLFGILRDGVKLREPAVFLRRQSSRIGQRVALQAFLGGEIDALKHSLCGFYFARLVWQTFESHKVFYHKK